MILVDSSVWIDLFCNVANRQTDRLTALLKAGDALVCTGDLILMELLQGAKDDLRAQKIARRMSIIPAIAISDVGLVVMAADNYRTLRARGITVRKTIDTLIATRCILDGYPLLYSNRDFDPFVEHLGLQSAMA